MIKIKGPERIKELTREKTELDLERALEMLARKFVAAVQDEIRTKNIIDRGFLLRSIRILRPGRFERDCISSASHAPVVEYGRRPGGKFPPLIELQQWCRRHGLPMKAAFPIARKIQIYGLPPRPFWRPSVEKAEKERTLVLNKIDRNYKE